MLKLWSLLIGEKAEFAEAILASMVLSGGAIKDRLNMSEVVTYDLQTITIFDEVEWTFQNSEQVIVTLASLAVQILQTQDMRSLIETLFDHESSEDHWHEPTTSKVLVLTTPFNIHIPRNE